LRHVWLKFVRRGVAPFGPTNTTAQLGRRAVGIERSEKYCALAVERLAQGALDFGGAA
jgi:hypothetical protein